MKGTFATSPLPPAVRRLTSSDSVRDWLCWSHERMIGAIEEGLVPYAFDLRSPGSNRCVLRIWHPNAEALVRSGGKDAGPRCDSLDALLVQLVPDLFNTRSSSLERLWSISHQHVHQLLRGAISDPGARKARSGPASYVAIPPASLRRFLRSRLVGHAVNSLN